jgi:voltage-gated potassium channel
LLDYSARLDAVMAARAGRSDPLRRSELMARLNPVERRLERFLREPPSVRNAASVIVIATLVVVVAAGALMTVIDKEEYPDVGIGMWWAVQTVTTVGYGDVTPADTGGRLMGALVMLQGTAFIAIVTAAITSTFVARAGREYQAAVAEDEGSDAERIDRRFDELERKLDLIMAAQDTRG